MKTEYINKTIFIHTVTFQGVLISDDDHFKISDFSSAVFYSKNAKPNKQKILKELYKEHNIELVNILDISTTSEYISLPIDTFYKIGRENKNSIS